MTTDTLPVTRACELPVCPPEHRWLIEDLWAEEAVGIVGGEPKCGKSFLALDMLVAVAAGVPCLRRFRPARRGPVLLYAAEDALHLVRSRLEGICHAAGVALADLPIHVITAPSLRLDVADDRHQLHATVAALRPLLLVLDPFVRLHRIDENASSEVAPLLASLRELQRRFALAVVVVHHARKGAHAIRAGQALRGTSDFHAWGDSNLYLRRVDDRLLLSIEHRAAPSQTDLPLVLRCVGEALALAIVEAAPVTPPRRASPVDRLDDVLAHTDRPLTLVELRHACRMRTAHVCQALAALTAQGRVHKTPAGYQLASRSAVSAVPFLSVS
ncbi:MAG: AAA family ATPase [Candidatus Atribacteria bacterium]|nr:AAA family ATPase [Candidatus Atribacteria bacterium]